MKTKLSPRFWAALTVFSLMGQVAWVVENMYFNVFIYKMFHASAADISAMVAASAVAATLTTVFMGALSDRLGKRKTFIALGYILWGLSIFAFVFLREDLLNSVFPSIGSAAALGVTLAIVLDCVMTFFGSTANDAAFNAWLTDSTDSTNRGAAEGINAMMPLVAILVVFGGFMFIDLSAPSGWVTVFSVIGTVVLVIGIAGFWLIREPELSPCCEPYLKTIVYGFLPSTVRKNPTLYVSLLAFVVFNISIQIFMPYLILYYEVSLGMSNYVLIMAPAIIIAAAVTAVWGKVYDKKGFSFSGLIALMALMVGYVILFCCKSTLPVFVGSLLMMSGYLAGMAVFGAVIRDHTPIGKSGMLQGVRIFAQVLLPGIIGPYVGKTVLANAEMIVNNDGTTSFVPNRNIFLAALLAAVLVLPFFLWVKRIKKPRLTDLKTSYEELLIQKEIPFGDYPRPQLKRDSYLCLNGKWSFRIKHGEALRKQGEILVPFVPESRISGINCEVKKDDVLIYERQFSLPEGFAKDRVLLHFGAVDQYASVFVNGQTAGEHSGGYLPFCLDITELLINGENRLRVEVRDPLDLDLPYGKQSNKRGGMWYTKTSGIWQTVWLESVPEQYIRSLSITPSLTGVTLTVDGGVEQKKLLLKTQNGEQSYDFVGDTFELTVDHPQFWTPETPHLYDFTLISGADRVESYFALRTVTVQEVAGRSLLCLNGKPYFFHGLLDQGYFSDGIFLPADAQGFKDDIMRMKSCGFNMLRKHIKLEPDLFYYYCDKYGMAVFQDFINNGKYSFLMDTALPTVFLKRGISHPASPRRRQAFFETSEGIQELLYNHPSVCYYTIFNEGWGQFSADECYTRLKELDPTRIYDTASGWFKAELSDVESDHVYFKPVRLRAKNGKPMVLSEFGGYSCKIADHSFNLDHTYGYRFFTDTKAFEQALIALYQNEILPQIKEGLCATVLTQVSDVEDETNGLLTYDRAVLKVDEKRLTAVAQQLKDRFYETTQADSMK